MKKRQVIWRQLQSTVQIYRPRDVNVTMDNKTYSVYIRKKIWENGIGFTDFVELLKTYLLTV